jgi:hypothetical protein
MNQLFSECLLLANTGIKAVQDYSGSKEASRILDAFFRADGRKLTKIQLNKIQGIICPLHWEQRRLEICSETYNQ